MPVESESVQQATQTQVATVSGDGLATQPEAGGVSTTSASPASPEPEGGSRFQERISELVAQRKVAETRADREAAERQQLFELLRQQPQQSRQAEPPPPDKDEDPSGYALYRVEQEARARRELDQRLARMEHERTRGQALVTSIQGQGLDFGKLSALAQEHLAMKFDLNPQCDLRREALAFHESLGLNQQPTKKPAPSPANAAYVQEKKQDAAATREPKPGTPAPPPVAPPPANPAQPKSLKDLQAEVNRDMKAALAAQMGR